MTKNKMICDVETGICGDASDVAMEMIDLNQPEKKVTLYYITDPICSHCWALEPVLRRFEKQYGQYFNVQTVMGGLLETWEGFADVANGISGPADVAAHWREVGEHSRMPIDGSVWLENPIHSSYPPSRVFKIVQQKDPQLANTFLRRAREAVFAFNQNIADEPVLIDILNQMNLDGETIVKEANSEAGEQLLQQDFALVRQLGVRGFPTIILVNEENKGIKIVGARPLDYYVQGLQQALSVTEPLQTQTLPALSSLLEEEGLLFSKEIEVLYDIDQTDIPSFIQKELSADSYELNEILGETSIKKTIKG